MYPPLITPWTHRNHSQTPHSLSIHSAFWKGIVPCFCKNNLATEQDISGKELTLHCSFYVLALSIQKTKSLHYNFCCNISDQLIISSTKWSLKFALWKRNLINNFVELRQHKRYEIQHREVEMKHFYFPNIFSTNYTSQFAFWGGKNLTSTKDLKIQQLQFSNNRTYRCLREIKLVIIVQWDKILDNEWER